MASSGRHPSSRSSAVRYRRFDLLNFAPDGARSSGWCRNTGGRARGRAAAPAQICRPVDGSRSSPRITRSTPRRVVHGDGELVGPVPARSRTSRSPHCAAGSCNCGRAARRRTSRAWGEAHADGRCRPGPQPPSRGSGRGSAVRRRRCPPSCERAAASSRTSRRGRASREPRERGRRSVGSIGGRALPRRGRVRRSRAEPARDRRGCACSYSRRASGSRS